MQIWTDSRHHYACGSEETLLFLEIQDFVHNSLVCPLTYDDMVIMTITRISKAVFEDLYLKLAMKVWNLLRNIWMYEYKMCNKELDLDCF